MKINLSAVYILCRMLGGAPDDNPLAVTKDIRVWIVGDDSFLVIGVSPL